MDDTSIIVNSPNLENFKTQMSKIFEDVNNLFKINKLVLNLNKTHYLQFNTKTTGTMTYSLIIKEPTLQAHLPLNSWA